MKKARRSIRTLLLCFTCIGSFCFSLHAKTYYLDAVTGNDTFPGTSTQPWKTLSKSIAEAINSDSIFIMNGNYGAYIENRGSANRSNWITYIASSGQTSVIFEYIRVTGTEVDAYLHFEGIDIFYPAQPTCPPVGNAIDITSLPMTVVVEFISITD